MCIRYLIFASFFIWSNQCFAQIKHLDSTSLYFTFQGNTIDTFELKSNERNLNEILIALNVQGNYLECVLENQTDSTFRLFHSCGQLKTFIEYRKSKKIEYPSGCDYDGKNYRILYPKTGFNIYIPKSPHWRNMELRVGLFIGGRKIYSNWVRYE